MDEWMIGWMNGTLQLFRKGRLSHESISVDGKKEGMPSSNSPRIGWSYTKGKVVSRAGQLEFSHPELLGSSPKLRMLQTEAMDPGRYRVSLQTSQEERFPGFRSQEGVRMRLA